MPSLVKLSGLSGRTYDYVLCVVNKPWINKPGNYAFLNEKGWPVYIGETTDFSTRMPRHDMWATAYNCGARFIVAHEGNGGEAVRKAEESDLIRRYNPICNTQHKHPSALGLSDLFAPGLLGPRKGLLGGK